MPVLFQAHALKLHLYLNYKQKLLPKAFAVLYLTSQSTPFVVRLGNTTLLGEGAQNHPHGSPAAWNNQLWSSAAAASETTFKNLKVIRSFSSN